MHSPAGSYKSSQPAKGSQMSFNGNFPLLVFCETLGADATDCEVFQVRLEAEFLGEGIAKLLQVVRAQVKRPVANPANHVVMGSVGVGQLVVQPVSDGYLRHHPQLPEKVKSPVYGSHVHVRIGILGLLENLVHSHMTVALGHYVEHDQPLGREPVPLLP